MSNFIIFAEAEGQTLSDEIDIDGRPLDLTGATVKFNMRYKVSSDLKVDDASANVVDAQEGSVSYDWESTDIDEPGEYVGWWNIILPDTSNIETPEFSIIVAIHAPGLKTRTGTIYERAKANLPTTWNILEALPTYGDKYLQDKIEIHKLNVLGSVVAVEDEEDLDIRVQEFIAKCAVLSVIPAGVDYWLDQQQMISATGTHETVSFPDRISALWKLYEKLMAEIAREQPIIDDITDTPIASPAGSAPQFSEGTDEGFVTPLPGKNFKDYAFELTGTRRNRRTW